MRARPTATHVGFLRYRNSRWARLAALLAVVCVVAYAWHAPRSGPRGDSALGYTLGTIGALLIVWLACLGIRKRRYHSTLGSVQGWVSAHVYLGLALLFVGTLHTGFEFGWNVHTLAYALMIGVIVSGGYGLIAYTRYPAAITRHRGSGTRDAWLAEIVELNEQALKLADRLGSEIHRIIVRSNERVKLGGNAWHLLRRRQPADTDVPAALRDKLRGAPRGDRTTEMPATSTMMFMASKIIRAQGAPDEAELAHQLLDTLARRNALVEQLNEDLRLHARMQVWLYVHVPLTLALLAALIAHVVAVFIYW
jgi:hypothetical protein